MNCLDFEFDGHKLSDYGCVIGILNGVPDSQSSSGADLQFSQGHGSRRDIFDLYDTHYEEPYVISFTICKDPCANPKQEDMYFTPTEISNLQHWLCRRNGYYKFKIDQEGYENIFWMGNFQSQQITMGGNCIGFALTLTTNAPYAFKEAVTQTSNCTSNHSFTINSVSQEEGYIIPNMTIQISQAGDLILANNRDTREMLIDNCLANETITIDGSHLIITSTNSAHDLGHDFNYYFPRIFTAFGNTANNYTVNLNCIITTTYNPIIKIGL